MKLHQDIKGQIQSFVYFLFKGTIDKRLIGADFHYLDKLIDSSELLYNCFEIFSYSMDRNPKGSHILVGDYIQSLFEDDNFSKFLLLNEILDYNKNQKNYLKDFLQLAKCFCFNSFPNSVVSNYLKELKGCGTDAVPTFAVWTNVISIDENLIALNSNAALLRANERIKLWDTNKRPIDVFEEWELEQEII